MKSIELNKEQEKIKRIFTEQISKFAKSEKVMSVGLVLLILIGLFGLFRQITIGHGVTGMRDNVVWGYFISNFIYFIGVSYGSALIAAMLYIFRVRWGRPVIRIAILTAFISGIIGPVFILLCIGRFDRLHYLFIHARVQSPITWDVMVIATYLLGITVFMYLMLIKDFGILSQSEFDEESSWKSKLYKWLSLGYDNRTEQSEFIDKSRKSVAYVIIPKVILAFAVLSWIFGMTIRPGWHSTIFGPSYIISSGATAVGLIIILMWCYRKWYNLDSYITDLQFSKMAWILFTLVAIFGYFTFSEYVTIWYSSREWESQLMEKLFAFSEFGWPFHLSNALSIILPLVLLSFRRFRTPNYLMLISFPLVISMWVKRYLTVVPTLETTLLPIQDTRPNYLKYSATWEEWALVFAGAATFILFFILIPKVVNIIPISKDYENR